MQMNNGRYWKYTCIILPRVNLTGRKNTKISQGKKPETFKSIFKTISQMSNAAKSLVQLVDCQVLKQMRVTQAEMRWEPNVSAKLLETF